MDARSAVIRTLCFHAAWGYAPTLPELVLTLDGGANGRESIVDSRSVDSQVAELKKAGLAVEQDGRLALAEGGEAIIARVRERDMFQARKRRAARRVARWLASLGSVSFVALANTTALGGARDAGDLDFFVVARRGSLWATRLLGAGAFKLLGRLPAKDRTRDAVCLSYFVTDQGLDLSRHQLPDGDPYFRYWFLSLLPLYDDGIGESLWAANAALVARHPLARRWAVPPDLEIRERKHGMRNAALRPIEPLARAFQRRWFPARIKELMNRDTRVMVDDRTLKFHVDDRRADFRGRYLELCRKYGVSG